MLRAMSDRPVHHPVAPLSEPSPAATHAHARGVVARWPAAWLACVIAWSLSASVADARPTPPRGAKVATRPGGKAGGNAGKASGRSGKAGASAGKAKAATAKAKASAKAGKPNGKRGAPAAKASARLSPAQAKKAAAVAKKAAAAEAAARAKLQRQCKSKAAAKTKTCRAFFAAEKERAAEAAHARLVASCKSAKRAKTAQCKALRAQQARAKRSAEICGRRFGRAKKNESVASFAKRYRVRESEVRRLNDLGNARRLRGGKRYVVYKSPFEGERLHDGVLLEPIEDVIAMQRPERGWGRAALVSAIVRAARAVQGSEPRASSLVVGDLSKEGGGCLPPHRSHRGGLDADIGYFHLGGKQRTWLGLATPEDIDPDRTWQFLAALRATGRLRYAFIDYDLQPVLYAAALRAGETPERLSSMFQYPRPRDATKSGVIRHLQGHADHMHIRLACEAGQPCELSDEVGAAVEATDVPMRGRVGDEGRRGRVARGAPRLLPRPL